MGMYDTVVANCPNCNTRVEFQSKAGPCECKVYHNTSVPADIARDVIDDMEICGNCSGKVYILGLVPRISLLVSSEEQSFEFDKPNTHSNLKLLLWRRQ